MKSNNPKHKDNLKPFQKGCSGNPKGRTKKLPELDVILANVLGEEQKDITAAEAILMSLRQKALKGDVRAAELLLDRAYGKMKQSVDHTTNGKDLPGSDLDLSKLTTQELLAMESMLSKAETKNKD